MVARSPSKPRLCCPTLPKPPGVVKIILGLDRHHGLALAGFRRAALPVEAGPPPALPAPEETVSAGRKIHAKALKLLVCRKENEAQGPSFRGWGKDFRRKTAHFAAKEAPSARKRSVSLRRSETRKNARQASGAPVMPSQSAEGSKRRRRLPFPSLALSCIASHNRTAERRIRTARRRIPVIFAYERTRARACGGSPVSKARS
jgi:hypothetical protein